MGDPAAAAAREGPGSRSPLRQQGDGPDANAPPLLATRNFSLEGFSRSQREHAVQRLKTCDAQLQKHIVEITLRQNNMDKQLSDLTSDSKRKYNILEKELADIKRPLNLAEKRDCLLYTSDAADDTPC
eukprot:5527906-Pyramimonas_sp.AAC.1